MSSTASLLLQIVFVLILLGSVNLFSMLLNKILGFIRSIIEGLDLVKRDMSAFGGSLSQLRDKVSELESDGDLSKDTGNNNNDGESGLVDDIFE